MKVFNNGKTYKKRYRGCSPFRNKSETLVLYPSCKLWFWHTSCLKQIYEKRRILCTIRVSDDSDWKCIHCLKALWECNSLIRILSDYFPNLLYKSNAYFLYNELLTQCWLNADYILTNYWLNIDQNILTSKIWQQSTYYVWNIHDVTVQYIHSSKFP